MTRLLGTLLALALVDAGATLVWYELGGLDTEGNPLMRWALEDGPEVFAGAKLALALLPAFILWRYQSHLWAWRGAHLCVLIYSGIAFLHLVTAGMYLAGWRFP
jgi:hypothetical protein